MHPSASRPYRIALRPGPIRWPRLRVFPPMPIHKLRTIFDAREIVDRYELRRVGPPLGGEPRHWSWEDFANWLFVRTTSVGPADLNAYIEEFDAQVPADAPGALEFGHLARVNADDAMSGVQVYEKRANDLMWIIRRLRATGRGRWLLDVIAAMATSTSVMETLEDRSDGDMQPLEDALIAISRLGTFESATEYRPGNEPRMDFFIRLDITMLDETLADESLWRDEEDMLWPLEVKALAAAAAIYVEELTRRKNATSVH